MKDYLLVIDQGTTSTRALIFDRQFKVIGLARKEFLQSFPQSGWVEHCPETIWQDVLNTCHEAIKTAHINIQQVAGIAITNQRETTVIWDRKTGQAIYPAIVWQDRRTAEYCQQLSSAHIQEKTGLLLDPYFSASKIAWILEHVKDARNKAENGELAFGTIECYLLWRLTGGKVHASDITNAARTLLFNIHTQTWDQALLTLFNIPASLLPEVLDNNAHFGTTDKHHLGESLPIVAMIGDQQAAAFGQACFQPNDIKSTYGTGCFILMNTGDKVIQSKNRLLSTVAYRINHKITYALEGSIFNAGTAIQWLRDGLGIIKTAQESETIANQVNSTDGVYLIPSFTGLGAPYWEPNARGAIFGLTRNTKAAHIVRAALESVAYRTKDLINAMQLDANNKIISLRVDGGMVNNNLLMQFLADVLQIPIARQSIIETTALGAAYMAALQLNWLHDLEEITHISQSEKTFTPKMPNDLSESLYQGWLGAVARIIKPDPIT
ncbi:MAG: glycerol kinase GlpK [Gammaproteobacteria bacterium]|jgi:glycerol kinase